MLSQASTDPKSELNKAENNAANAGSIDLAPENQPMFITACLRIERVTTVIFGIPFYKSSGKNSGAEGTLFPYLGIRADKWLVKPKWNFSADIIQFYKDLEINEPALSRFGNLLTLGISASLGGGFWETTKGREFAQFIFTNYPDCQFPGLAAINQAICGRELDVVTDVNETNRRLSDLGSIIIPNIDTNRLPSLSEFVYFTKTHSSSVSSALSLLLTTTLNIDETKYQLLVKLNDYPKLFECVFSHYLLEDSDQAQTLFGLLGETEDFDKLTVSELEQINILMHCTQAQSKMMQSLLLDQNNRNLIRNLCRNKLLNDEVISLLHALKKLNLLEVNPAMLGDHEALSFLTQFHRHGKLTEAIFWNLSELYDKKLMNEVASFIQNGKFKNHSVIDTQLIYKMANELNQITRKTKSMFFEESPTLPSPNSLLPTVKRARTAYNTRMKS